MTNSDKIRAMTDEELAYKLARIFGCNDCPISDYCNDFTKDLENWVCPTVWIEWLKQEVSDNV